MWSAGPARRVPEAGRPQALRLGFALTPGMRVGLFGGSFNPAHEGHAHVAETAQMRLGLDRVIWLVSPQNPLKTDSPASLEERLEGARAFARGRAMVASAAEAALGTTYSLDTIRLLKVRHPGVRFVWIMGADSLGSFHRWKGWVQIFRELPIAVIARPGAERALTSPAARRFAHARVPAGALVRATPPAWAWVSAPLNFTSSTALRERLTQTSR